MDFDVGGFSNHIKKDFDGFFFFFFGNPEVGSCCFIGFVDCNCILQCSWVWILDILPSISKKTRFFL